MDLNGLKRMDNQQENGVVASKIKILDISWLLKKLGNGAHCAQINKCQIPFLRSKHLPKQ